MALPALNVILLKYGLQPGPHFRHARYHPRRSGDPSMSAGLHRAIGEMTEAIVSRTSSMAPSKSRAQGTVSVLFPNADDAAGELEFEPYAPCPEAPAEISDEQALTYCARLWCIGTHQRFDPDSAVRSAEFQAFLATTGAETPQITPLFDTAYFGTQLSWQNKSVNYYLHYCKNFRSAGLRPHILFDDDYVLSQIANAAFDRPPLLHFLELNDPELSPHPLFDPKIYARAVGEEFLDGELPIVAFISRWAERPAPFSAFFCHRFYCLHEPMVRFGRLNPLIHFLFMPPERRRDPNPMFQRGWYAGKLPEGELNDMDPLVHYIRFGLPRGLMPNPFAYEELHVESLGLSSTLESLRQYISFPQGVDSE